MAAAPSKPCQASLALPTPANPTAGMVQIKGGTFSMGAAAVHSEEGPPAKVKVGSFWIDQTEVTNAAFAQFVAATGYVTLSERPLDPKVYPQLSGDQLNPSSLVFVGMLSGTDRSNPAAWWSVFWSRPWLRTPSTPCLTVCMWVCAARVRPCLTRIARVPAWRSLRARSCLWSILATGRRAISA